MFQDHYIVLMLDTKYPVTQNHIPEEWIPKWHMLWVGIYYKALIQTSRLTSISRSTISIDENAHHYVWTWAMNKVQEWLDAKPNIFCSKRNLESCGPVGQLHWKVWWVCKCISINCCIIILSLVQWNCLKYFTYLHTLCIWLLNLYILFGT